VVTAIEAAGGRWCRRTGGPDRRQDAAVGPGDRGQVLLGEVGAQLPGLLGAGDQPVAEVEQSSPGRLQGGGLREPHAHGVIQAAIGLTLLMVRAVTHRRRGELPMIGINTVLLVLALVVAWARFGPYSLQSDRHPTANPALLATTAGRRGPAPSKGAPRCCVPSP
jgi:hypothetical protein